MTHHHIACDDCTPEGVAAVVTGDVMVGHVAGLTDITVTVVAA